MARNRRNQNGNGNARSGDDEFEAPEGFTINVGRERGDGWVKKEEGNEVMARIVGRYTYSLRGKKRAYYQLKLLKPCQIEVEDPDFAGDGDEEVPRVTMTADEGALVNCDETAKLAELEAFTKTGGVYDVWFVFKGKKDIGAGQSMWDMAGPRVRVVTKPSEVPQD